MSFQAAPQGVKVEIVGSQNGVPIVNVMHVDAGHAPTDTDLTDINALYVTWVKDHMLAECNESLVINQVITTDISVEDGHQIAETLTADNTGALTVEAAPANAAACVSLRTAKIGRSYRGRFYLGGLDMSGINDAQFLKTTYAFGIASQFPVLIDNLLAAGYKLVVLSRYLNKALRVVAALTEVIQVICDTKIDSQRRRTAN